jgi:hypothetical protein
MCVIACLHNPSPRALAPLVFQKVLFVYFYPNYRHQSRTKNLHQSARSGFLNMPNPTSGDLLTYFRLGIKRSFLISECHNNNRRIQLRPLWAERSELLNPLLL